MSQTCEENNQSERTRLAMIIATLCVLFIDVLTVSPGLDEYLR